MPIEELILDSKKKNDREKFESIVRNCFDKEALIKIILEDVQYKEHKFSPHIAIKSKIFSDTMREAVEPIKVMDIKANLVLLKAEYESLDKKCWDEFFMKLPKKLVYYWDLIINENLKVIQTVLKAKQIKIKTNLLEELERERNYLENIFNLYDKLSYEEITNETMALLQDHLKLQKYAIDKDLLPAS